MPFERHVDVFYALSHIFQVFFLRVPRCLSAEMMQCSHQTPTL